MKIKKLILVNKDNDTAVSGFDRIFGFVSVCLLALSLILPIWVGFHNYATGDDLFYGAGVHNILKNHGSVFDMLRFVADLVVDEWYSFQGTWSSELLWCFEPSVWSENAYKITFFIAVISLSAGTGYLLYILLVRCLGINGWICAGIVSWVLFYSIQYMPYPRGGLYWFTGMLHYTFAYGIALLSIGWGIMWIKTSKIRYIVGTALSMIYMGGAGYPAIAVSGVLLVFLIIIAVLDETMRIRGSYIIIPLLFLLAGFTVSAMAPGNANRGGTGYEVSIMSAILALLKSVPVGTGFLLDIFLEVRPLILLPVGLFAVAVGIHRQFTLTLQKLLTYTFIGFVTICLIHAPELFAGDTVVSGISGGVYDSYFYISVLFIAIESVLLGLFFGEGIRSRLSYTLIRNLIFAGMLLFCMILYRHLIGNMLDYICYRYISSGEMADYEAQMQERFKLLSTDDRYVELPAINSEQGPLMHFSVTPDPDSYSNQVTARFYDKDTVVGVDRTDEYYQ